MRIANIRGFDPAVVFVRRICFSAANVLRRSTFFVAKARRARHRQLRSVTRLLSRLFLSTVSVDLLRRASRA
jgi:hypothetical protein